MSANDEQVGGRHYIDKPFQPWDYIVGNKLGYLEGNIIKYVSRYKEKGGLEDLIKAAHYLDKLIEVTRNEQKRISEVTVSASSPSREEVKQVGQE
jgi:hypothetical protein